MVNAELGKSLLLAFIIMKLIGKIQFLLAAQLLLGILALVLVFHSCVLLGWIPNTIVWGGRLQSRDEFYVMETSSLLINGLLIWIIAQRAGYVKQLFSDKALKVCLWTMAVLFAINTAGNLFAISTFEKVVFTPLTCISAFFCARLALGSDQN